MRRLAAAVLLVLALAGCAPWYGTGTVMEKDHDPAYTTVWCHPVGKVTVCTPMVHPERWDLRLHAEDGDHWVQVDQDQYDRVHVGQRYTVAKA